MAGTKEINADLDVKGTVKVSTAPNSTGNFLTMGSGDVISTRTPAEVLADIGAAPSSDLSDYELKAKLSPIKASSSTAAATVAKVATTPGGTYSPVDGDTIQVTFTSSNTAASATLNIDGSGAYPVQARGQAAPALSFKGLRVIFYFDGTGYQLISSTLNDNTTYSAMSVAEMETGTATTLRTMRADYLNTWLNNKNLISQTQADERYLQLAGGTVTGQIKRTTDAVAADDVPRLSQVESLMGQIGQASVFTISGDTTLDWASDFAYDDGGFITNRTWLNTYGNVVFITRLFYDTVRSLWVDESDQIEISYSGSDISEIRFSNVLGDTKILISGRGGAGVPTLFTQKGNWVSGIYSPSDWVVDRSVASASVQSAYFLRGSVDYNSTTQPYLDSAHWTEIPTITGPEGPPGIQGVPGADGEDGTDGNTWYSGTSAPATGLGVVGDFHLHTTTWDVREKTGASTWTVVGNIKGATGETGAAGQGVPTGGTTGQVLSKIDGTNYNTEWTSIPTPSMAYTSIIGVSANRTISLTDVGAYWIVTGARTITIPTNATVAFPIGERIDIAIRASASTIFSLAGGVTLNHSGGTGAVTKEGILWLSLIKVATNEWDIVGG